MMKVIDILNEVCGQKHRQYYELKMSCMTSEYTKQNPLSSKCGWLYDDCGFLNFEIDWNGRAKTLVNELFLHSENTVIIAWDTDDGNMIEFEECYIDDENELVILI